MRPSSRFQYALRALADLALHQPTGPVTVSKIARRQRIPVRYLEQLLNRLRREGIVVAERGPRGGYRLGRPAGQIPVSEIFQGVESTVLRRAVHPELKSKGERLAQDERKMDFDPAAALWRQVEACVQRTLEATTLGDLATQLQEQVPPPLNHRYTFHI